MIAYSRLFSPLDYGLMVAVLGLGILCLRLYRRVLRERWRLAQAQSTIRQQQHNLQMSKDALVRITRQGGATAWQLNVFLSRLEQSEFDAAFLWEDLLDESGDVLDLLGRDTPLMRRLERSRVASRQGLALLSDGHTLRQGIYQQMARSARPRNGNDSRDDSACHYRD